MTSVLPLALFAVLAHGADPKADAEKIAAEAKKSVVVVTVEGRDGRQHGQGTGFVVSKDGLVATNLHVIGEARPVMVTFADGRSFKVASVHASDRSLDLAVLKIDAKKLSPLKLFEAENIPEGRSVVVLGNPHGLRHSVVSGVVSGTRELEGRKVLQLAIPIEPGNSGGPVLDHRGQVLGIVAMKSTVSDNLGFAVPVSDLKALLDKPNPVPMKRWLTIGALDPNRWTIVAGSDWRQRSGRIHVREPGEGFGGRSLCLSKSALPKPPYEVAVWVKLDDEKGAAGLAFCGNGRDRHYGFYPSGGSLRLTRFEGPSVFTWKVLEEFRSPHYRPGEWNHLKVRIEKDRLIGYVNDRKVVESKDTAFRDGVAGLAKFRQTQAEFKRFESAESIAPKRPDPALTAKVEKQIESLPPLGLIQPRQLDPLVAQADGGLLVIRQRARRMADEAKRLEKLAHDVHVRGVVKSLKDVLAKNPKALGKAALLVAKLDHRELDVPAYLQRLDKLAVEASQSLGPKATEDERRQALDDYLFEKHGYHGSRTDYGHQANSHINRVMDDREGLPITLSVLYMALGRRMGLKVVGVGLPGHFIVRVGKRHVDVFERGRSLTREDLGQIVRLYTRGPLRDEHLVGQSPTQIVLRMLNNLMRGAQERNDREAVLRYLEAMVALSSDDVGLRGMRGVVRFETGRKASGIADLNWILERKPPNLNLDRVRQMRDQFQEELGAAAD